MDARVFLSPRITADGRWLLVTASYGLARTEIWFNDLAKTGEALRLLTPGTEAQFFVVEAGPAKLLLATTWNAPRRRAPLVDLERPMESTRRVAFAYPASCRLLLAGKSCFPKSMINGRFMGMRSSVASIMVKEVKATWRYSH
jgi:hypothetical protein